MKDILTDTITRRPYCGVCDKVLVGVGDPEGTYPQYRDFLCPLCKRIYKVNQFEWPHISQRYKNHIANLYDKHHGKTIAVLGAGKDLEADIEKLPPDTVFIGVNHHAEVFVTLDYICFADHPDMCPVVAEFMPRYIGRRVTPLDDFSDWKIDVPHMSFGKSFPVAVWLAEFMGAIEIVLCGFDCYTKGGNFDNDFKPSKDLAYNAMVIWRRVAAEAKRPDIIKAASGILSDVFGRYE